MNECKASFLLMAIATLSIAPATCGVAFAKPREVTRAPVSRNEVRARLVVLSDMGADPDDSQSLTRLLVYADDIEIMALIATTSRFQKTRVAPQSIAKIIAAYGRVQPNLAKHEAGYPRASELLGRVSSGPPFYGMEGVGRDHDSSGSERIIQLLQQPDPRPLWVSVWGGPNVLAQALWKIRATMPADQAEQLYAKLRVYAISDQDDSGPWIRRTFPKIFYIVSPGLSTSATWLGMTKPDDGADKEVVSEPWIAAHIQQGHGPLGAVYPDVAYTMEGDTPSYLGLIRNGLNNMEHPNWGGWGGRYELATPERRKRNDGLSDSANATEPESRPIWTDAQDSYAPPQYVFGHMAACPSSGKKPEPSNFATIWRWRTDVQNDFAARMDWSIKSYAEANHRPVALIEGATDRTVTAGDLFSLDASNSYDPDGDSLSFLWSQYPEAGTFRGQVCFPGAMNLAAIREIKAPEVSSPQTIHFILRVTDKGTPPLTSYRRVIVTVKPREK